MRGPQHTEAGGGEEPPLLGLLVLRTLGAPERRRLRGRRGRMVEDDGPAAVPTTRATVVRPQPFGGDGDASSEPNDAAQHPRTAPDAAQRPRAALDQAERWLREVRDDEERTQTTVDEAIRLLNRCLHAYRVAAADASVADVDPRRALVTRIGFGDGEAIADARFAQAWKLPPIGPHRPVRSMEAPEERFAAILGGRTPVLACEELTLRARADLHAGRTREAALEARVALEALLAELPEHADELADARASVREAANAALAGELPRASVAELDRAIERLERLLRHRRLTT